jgi:hypothetical protein
VTKRRCPERRFALSWRLGHGIIAYGSASREVPTFRRAAASGAVLFGVWPTSITKADDQQLAEDYLKGRGANGAVVRPITEDFVGRSFPNFSFFGVIFRQYPVAVVCPQMPDLKCSNVFFVKDSGVDCVSNIEDLKFFFASQLRPALSLDAANDDAATWLRLSEELKQDLFYTFSAPEVSACLGTM